MTRTGYSLPPSECLTLLLQTSRITSEAGKGTGVGVLCRQSMSRRWSFLPMQEMNWSMMPQGVWANSISARWQRSAFVIGSMCSPNSTSRNVAKETSSAAEELTPAPSGTFEQMTAFTCAPGGRSPR